MLEQPHPRRGQKVQQVHRHGVRRRNAQRQRHNEQQQRAAAQQQADKILTAARENAENDRKKIMAEANREAVSIAEDAMEKLLAAQTARAYDSFVNAAEGEERHEQ